MSNSQPNSPMNLELIINKGESSRDSYSYKLNFSLKDGVLKNTDEFTGDNRQRGHRLAPGDINLETKLTDAQIAEIQKTIQRLKLNITAEKDISRPHGDRQDYNYWSYQFNYSYGTETAKIAISLNTVEASKAVPGKSQSHNVDEKVLKKSLDDLASSLHILALKRN